MKRPSETVCRRRLIASLLAWLVAGCGGPALETVPDYPAAQFAGRDRASDWTAYLPELLPPLLRCVEATPGDTPRVVSLWPMNRGMAGVRLVNAGRETYDCVAPIAGAGVDRLESQGRNLPRQPGEARSLFTAANARPPAGACYRHESVRDDAGQLLGWLSYDLC